MDIIAGGNMRVVLSMFIILLILSIGIAANDTNTTNKSAANITSASGNKTCREKCCEKTEGTWTGANCLGYNENYHDCIESCKSLGPYIGIENAINCYGPAAVILMIAGGVFLANKN